LHADVSRPARVLVNQNWAPGWHSSVGKVVSHEGLLAVDLPAGANDVELKFLPWSTLGAATVTAVSLAALALICWRARRRGEIFSRKQSVVTTMLVMLPWLVAGVAHAASPDDKWPPAPMTNPNGSPAIVADGDVHESTPIGATFALPLRVEEGRVSGPDEQKNILVEVYFRRLGSIPKATTMFVHLERRKDEPPVAKDREDFFNVDHQVVGGSFYLSDAPEGALVRDAFGAHVAKAGAGTWDVWVAFGHVSGRRGRATVTDKGQATVSSDRVKIGTFVIR
jgi:hypothetical protein